MLTSPSFLALMVAPSHSGAETGPRGYQVPEALEKKLQDRAHDLSD